MIINKWDLNIFILSTETNKVVKSRAEKLKISCHNGIKNKKEFVLNYLDNNAKNINPEGLVYLGNDLNDFSVMQLAGLSVAPSDAHVLIKNISNIVLDEKGGQGFVRKFIEKFIRIEELSPDKLKELIS